MEFGTFRHLTVPALTVGVLASIGAACSDEARPAAPTTEDAGPTPTGEGGAGADGGGTDASAPSDAGTDTAAPVPKPVSLAISPAGHDRFFGVSYDAAGNLYAVGQVAATTDAADDQETVVAKITPSGALDTTFGSGGVARINLVAGFEQPRNVIVQSTGKVVVAATVLHAGTVAADRDVAVARFDANGAVDTTFGAEGNGKVILNLSDPGATTSFDSQWGLALGPADAIFVEGGQRSPTGDDTDFAVVKLAADGALDTTFGGTGIVTIDVGPGYNASPRNLTVLPGGAGVIATGYFRNGTDATVDPVQPVLIKLLANGDRDPAFGTNGVYTETIYAVAFEFYGAALQGNAFIGAGYGRNAASESDDWLAARIKADGTRDLAWGNGGVARVDFAGQTDNLRNVVALPDGRFVVIGAGRQSSTNQDAMIGVLTANGQWDTSFGPKGLRTFDLGATDHFWGVALHPNGKTLAVGGISGAKGDGGNDDSLVYLLPL
ncbi:MAG: hypothetical protein JST00_24490 [Deltaproteobacteria bacterium]|nr:hypothetical protein [Deltaproteobacteria bacterium]